MTVGEASNAARAGAGDDLKAATRAAWALGDYHSFATETVFRTERGGHRR
jgi:hypothetical protein